MRRSRSIKLLFMSASVVALTACGEEIQTGVYDTVERCALENPVAECEKSLAAARQVHEETAPRFQAKEDCEQEFGPGRCEPSGVTGGVAGGAAGEQQQASAGSTFIPFMMGYMLANSLRSSSVAAQPVYQRNGASGFFTGTGSKVSDGLGRTMVNSASSVAKAPAMRAPIVARGGFSSYSAAS
ncbi:DUF1190 domain-containing protein [Oceanibaculum pacificum]|uniref:DUF1190 domain-containing protein n=1 Tax=Oceanibaculum pacificum TaxID=580166 RepID=A0A154VI40_9PROT|nr:DUF1190 domain-containing protein [Oceanibaculum pacificum]KZD01039.1 hypothetical protein AUP43_03625 [Oceanibaculum pacificum]